MMCLPSIASLHNRREEARKQLAKSKTLTCDTCDKPFPKDAKGRFVEEYHSPLIAGQAAGMVTICPRCAEETSEKYGHPYGMEGEESGFFTCCCCQKLQVYNHSWEVYAVTDEEDGGYCCQACAAKRYLAEDSDKWLDSTEAILAATKDEASLSKYGPKHLGCIGGDKSYPCEAVSFRDTPEYEKEGLSWFSMMEMGGYGKSGLPEVRECALKAYEFYREVAIIVGKSGQFQTYMDILVKGSGAREKKGGV